MATDELERQVSFGEHVYDDEGAELGRVRGIDENGFYVATTDDVTVLSSEHEADTMGGEKELMWRCWACGEMGLIDDMPAECPSCGAPKEDLYFWRED